MIGSKTRIVDQSKKKELKKQRNGILKAIGNIEATISVAEIGVMVGANEPESQEETAKSRQQLIQDLQEAKESLKSCCEQYEQLIDKAIQSMS